MASVRGRSPTGYFSQQLEKWAKEPEETNGFFTSLRAMHYAELQMCTARSRKTSFFVLLSNRLSTSAAAADLFAEKHCWFYR